MNIEVNLVDHKSGKSYLLWHLSTSQLQSEKWDIGRVKIVPPSDIQRYTVSMRYLTSNRLRRMVFMQRLALLVNEWTWA